MPQQPYLSVIIPVYNEAENISLLHTRLLEVVEQQPYRAEILYVDDGSTDETYSQLQAIIRQTPQVQTQVIRLRRNFGQTAAIAAGVTHSAGQVLIFMDGDLQNDPVDIPRLIAKLNEGYDVVSGWRKQRKDSRISRKLPSWVANRLISRVTGVYLHDYGCTLKAYRREIFSHIQLYGEMHRFIPAYAALAGAAIAELEVNHHPRRFGVSKYGISRTVRVILDLMTLKFLGSYGTKPLYAFGLPGLCSLLFGMVLCIILLAQKVIHPHVRVHRNPLLPLFILCVSFGLQCFMMGLLAEMLMRTYHESQGKPTYVVREILSTQPDQAGQEKRVHTERRSSLFKAPRRDTDNNHIQTATIAMEPRGMLS